MQKIEKSLFHPKTKTEKKEGGKSRNMKYNFMNVMMWMSRSECTFAHTSYSTCLHQYPQEDLQDPKNKNSHNLINRCENNVVNM